MSADHVRNLDAATLAGIQARREGYQLVLPAPFGPSNTVNEPLSIEKDTSLSNDARPKAWPSSLTNSAVTAPPRSPKGNVRRRRFLELSVVLDQ